MTDVNPRAYRFALDVALSQLQMLRQHAGVLQVICTFGDGQRVIMREFTDWTSYTVHRAQPMSERTS
jgi:hypothetical protein